MLKLSLAMSITLLAICFSLFNHAVSLPAGPITVRSGLSCSNIQISQDGETLVCTQNSQLFIFMNNQSNFQLNQILAPYPTCHYFFIAGHGKSMILRESQTLEIFEKSGNGTFILAYTISCNVSVTSVRISEDGNIIAGGSSTGILQIYKKNLTIDSYYLSQEISDSTAQILFIEGTADFSILVTSGDDSIIQVYTNDGTNFNLNQTISKPFGINQMRISQSQMIFAGSSSNISFYRNSGSGYIFEQNLQTPQFQISKFGINEDFSMISYGGFNGNLYIHKKINGSFTLEVVNTGDLIFHVISDPKGLYFIYTTLLSQVKVYFECPIECGSCSFPSNCLTCNSGYNLDAGKCIEPIQDSQPSQCVNNVYVVDGICQDYCHRRCKSCTTSRYKCAQCAELYTKNDQGECVIEDQSLSIFISIRPFLNLARKKGMKMIFMVVDDLWLYQYHKKRYDGMVKKVFKMISFIEQKQWEVIGLNGVIDEVQDQVTETRKYNAFSNQIYLFESRNANFLIDTILDFMVLYTPLTLILVLLWNKVFYLLFNYRISSYLRPYSFWLIVADILIQNNIEFFTFLGLRSLDTMFSFNFSTKALNAFSIIFIFIIISCVAYSYLLYYYKYGKLARYFLVNMFRFRSSYVLMIITYGVRPFLKGVIHAMFFEEWELQLWLLTGIQLLIVFVIIIFQIIFDSHKEKLMLILELFYSVSLMILNLLLLCKYGYMSEHQLIRDEIEVVISLTIYFMASLLIMRYLLEIKGFIISLIQSVNKSQEQKVLEEERKKTKKLEQMGKIKKLNKMTEDQQFLTNREQKQEQQEVRGSKTGRNRNKKNKNDKRIKKKQRDGEKEKDTKRQEQIKERKQRRQRTINKIQKIESIEELMSFHQSSMKDEKDDEVLNYYKKRLELIELNKVEGMKKIEEAKTMNKGERKTRIRKEKKVQ